MSSDDRQAKKKFTIDELIARARAMSPQQDQNTEVKKEEKRKGLEFMALRFNVVDKRRELMREKKITPAESCLLQEIELGTIGARNHKKKIGSQSEFYLEDLSSNLGYKSVNKIYALLKSLKKKGYITRNPTRSKGLELIGLNKEVFGQILIDKEHNKEMKRVLRLVHNSASCVDKSKNVTHESEVPNTRIESESHTNHVAEHTNRVQTDTQVHEITDKKAPLDSFRSILDSFKGEEKGPETFVSFGEEKAKRTQEEHLRIIRQQIAELQRGLM